MWNQSHLSEQLADVVSELPPSAEGEMVIMTKSLPFMLEWDHRLQCPSQPQPQLLSNKIIKLCKVGKTPFWWHKQEHLFSIPSGKPNGLMLVLGWLYSEVHGGSEMVPLMTVSLYIGLLCMISRACWKSWQCPIVSSNGVILYLLLKLSFIFYFPQYFPRILQACVSTQGVV